MLDVERVEDLFRKCEAWGSQMVLWPRAHGPKAPRAHGPMGPRAHGPRAHKGPRAHGAHRPRAHGRTDGRAGWLQTVACMKVACLSLTSIMVI